MLNFQSYNGHFQEYDNTSSHHAYIVENPFDETSYISLTAHVLIALERVMENLQGDHKLDVATAKQRGMMFLEKILPQIKDIYQLCIVTYTLALLKSSEADLAFNRLMGSFSEADGKIYWSSTPITANKYVRQIFTIS